MNEDRLRTELREALAPVALVPPSDLLGRVTRGNRRRRVRLSLAAAFAAVVAVAVPITLLPGVVGGQTADVTVTTEPAPWLPAPPPEMVEPPASKTPDPPEPGGGPMVIQSYMEPFDRTRVHYLLDLDTGEYVSVPDTAIVAPGLEGVLVARSGYLGVADRRDYLDNGDAAVHWFAVAGLRDWMGWSPDGSKILWRPDGVAGLCVLDLATDTITSMGLPEGYDDAWMAWAPDSSSLRLIHPDDGTSTLLTVGLDGRIGESVTVDGELRALDYSPSGTRALVREFTDEETGLRMTVRDTADWRVLADVTATLVTEGPDRFDWYDDHTVIRTTEREPWDGDAVVEVVDLVTGTIARSFDIGGLGIQSFGPSARLPESARELGF